MKGMAKLGQHFLANKNVAEKIVDCFHPCEGPIVEIGPGQGVLTLLLRHRFPHRKIMAVELDDHLADALRKKAISNLEIIRQDILLMNLQSLKQGDHYNLIGNLPYFISKEIVDWVLLQHSFIPRALFMVQKEFADKLMLRSRTLLPQPLVANMVFIIRKMFDVKPGSFSPPPRVTSTVLALTQRPRLPIGPIRPFYLFVKKCFQNQRKTLANNLRPSVRPEKLESVFRELEISVQARPGQLDLEIYVALFRKLIT
jgi:16S rRNA (adenine1518-N6/adenine1519-N6)-dimethyltransferase